ncbi:hypothetical protein BH11ACT8_BH11ACT8_03780 [soil metagenome]
MSAGLSALVTPTPRTRSSARCAVGVAAILFPLVYLVSDLVEVAQGDFTLFRLSLTYAGEAGFPLFVVGLAMLVQDWIPRWATAGALAYAYSYVFFTSTVVWAIAARTPDWETLGEVFGWWMTVHGAIMVVGGIAFGVGVARSGILPPWTGWALAVGVVLVAGASGMGNPERTVAAAVPDAAFIGMGIALLARPCSGSTEEAVSSRESPPRPRSPRRGRRRPGSPG